MIRNYFKIASRNLKKDLLFSFINIFGLMVGLASFILIALYVFDEFTSDSQHKDAESIYRVINTIWIDGTHSQVARGGYPISELQDELPEIKCAARHLYLGRSNVSDASMKNGFVEEFRAVNSEFLEVFDFKLLQGNPSTALNEPFSVVITEETATKIFNRTDVLGELLIIGSEGEPPHTITGVMENIPGNSHITFNLLVSESTILNDPAFSSLKEGWMRGPFQIYLLLHKNVDIGSLEQKINSIVVNNESDDYQRAYKLQPLKDIHFYSEEIEGGYVNTKGNITYIYAFSVVALLVLLIACINYINLTTARYTKRAKEIAMRKVVGASRKSLIGQFLSEAYVLTVISLILALFVVVLLLPYFNTFTGKELYPDISGDYRITLAIALIILFVGFISGLYPALFLSASKPMTLLKNKVKVGSGNLSLRRTLVVFQFSLSIIMVIATMVVFMQMKYVDSKDMGFTKDQLVVVDINSGKIRTDAHLIKDQFSSLAQVTDVSLSSRVPGEWKDIPKVKVRNQNIQNDEGYELFFLGGDERFIPTYEMELISGRNFRQGSVADSSAVIINETAAKALGITEVSEQTLEIQLKQPFMVNVVGIVKDFNFQTLKEPLAPMLLGYEKNPIDPIDYITAKVASGDVSETLEKMDKIMLSSDHENLFEYHFLDDQWDLFYEGDIMRQNLFLILSILTIFIACLGLLGLVTFEAKQRIKEIGIRRVSGASVENIITLLSKDLLKLVFLAAFISFPVAWYIMNKWLTEFAYRIDIPWWIFVVAGISALSIAFLTMSIQAFKAAISNPAKSLRTE
jgi:putative ABC transport system permease protein